MTAHRRELAVFAQFALAGVVVYGLYETAWRREDVVETRRRVEATPIDVRQSVAGEVSSDDAPPTDSLGTSLAGRRGEPPPTWFDEAVAEMRATNRPGIAIVLPADEGERELLRKKIEDLLRWDQFDSNIHLVETVYVIVERAQVGAEEGETAVLLDADGRRLEGAAVDFAQPRFATTVRPLLRARDRLHRRAKLARTAEVETALDELFSDDQAAFEAASDRLVDQFAAAGPAVIEAWEDAGPGRDRQSLRQVIDAAFRLRRDGGKGVSLRPLPFGARWNVGAAPADPCPGCGMMSYGPRVHDVLEFLAPDPATPK